MSCLQDEEGNNSREDLQNELQKETAAGNWERANAIMQKIRSLSRREKKMQRASRQEGERRDGEGAR